MREVERTLQVLDREDIFWNSQESKVSLVFDEDLEESLKPELKGSFDYVTSSWTYANLVFILPPASF